jgi:very-short-patch-repair endonuclease
MSASKPARKLGPYLNRVQNYGEEMVRRELESIAVRHGWRVYPGFKLTTLVDPKPPGISIESWTRATRQHLDFVVADRDRFPVFAVELDGKTHRTPEMIALDRIKDLVCQEAGLDLLRIESSSLKQLNDGRTVIEYLIDAHCAAEESGAPYSVHECDDSCLNPDGPDCVPGEVTDYRHYDFYLEGGRFIFPNYLVADANRVIFKATIDGLLASSKLTQCGFMRKDGWIEALAWVSAHQGGYVFQSVQVRDYDFPSLEPSQLAMDLCLLDIAQSIQRLQDGEPVIMREKEVTRHFRELSGLIVDPGSGGAMLCFSGVREVGGHHCPWPPACSYLCAPFLS